MRRLLRWLLGAALTLVLVGALGLRLYLRHPLPTDPGEILSEGISAAVAIRYDGFRRPFVSAESFQDALYAEGWLHARERLWQMELLRRAGQGRLAELLGSGLLDTDLEIHRVGVPKLARRLEANAGALELGLVDAYLRGVNAALAQGAGALELSLLGHAPGPWSREDVFALGALMAFQSGRNMRNELLRQALVDHLDAPLAELFGGAEAGAGAPWVSLERLENIEVALAETDFYAAPLLGSNGWVVAPERSASGRALFAFDSHDGFSMPNLFYEVHLFFDEGKSVRGWSVPGLPGVINGFNEHMAWGFTNIGDSQDLFLETRDPTRPTRFKGRDGWYEAEIESIEIAVAGAEPSILERVITENGPLIQEDPPISLAWSASQLGELGLEGLFRLNRADSLDAFMAAMDRFPAPSANATYADVAGHIVFRTVGLLPLRGAGRGLLPLRADVPGTAWQGLVPIRELPTIVDPPTGVLGAANAEVPGPVLVSADNAPGYRMTRLSTLLERTDKISLDDMRRWQMDWHNTQAERLLPTLLTAAGPGDGKTATALAVLERWLANPTITADSRAALLFDSWYLALARAVFEPELGPELTQRLLANSYVLNGALDALILDDTQSPWWQGNRERVLSTALASAVAQAGEGTRWGDVHELYFRHEMSGAVLGLDRLLDRGPFTSGGGNATLGRARYRYDRPFRATGGATVRVVMELAEPPRIGAIMPGGQSGHVMSGSYDDQFPAYVAGELHEIPALPDGPVVTRLTPREGSGRNP